MIDIKKLYKKLAEKALHSGQSHIFNNWDALTTQQQENLLRQAESIDFEALVHLTEQDIHSHQNRIFKGQIEPVKPTPIPGTAEEKQRAKKMAEIGERTLRAGKVCALLVAGGQGSRLGFEGPKGFFQISPVMNKSLFQLHCEKILALTKKYRTRIPFYIMTSEANHEETKQYFHNHSYFGLPKSEVFFFQQGMLPALDESGKLILDAPGHLFMNPNGHGGVFEALSRSNALNDMQQRGIEQIFYFQIDNVLIKICDPVFLGYHIHAKAEMSSKVCAKRHAHEKVGVIGKIDGKLGVIEYSDLSEEDKTATGENGELLYNAGSLAIHVIDLTFIRQLEASDFDLPLHVAHKKIPSLNRSGELITPDAPNGYKFEKFIFDALAFVKKSVVLEVDRSEEFSPVKNAEGEDSPFTAQHDLTRFFASWLKEAGFEIPEEEHLSKIRLEISPLFALEKEEFLKKFRGKGKIENGFYLE
jgi:UDP-N-acetylglucosamine/UDP-N-acetylgalactosamine diphosphorylase